METNESILTRKVVGLGDRKVLGAVNGLRVDCDSLGVCHYLVGSASTNSTLVLPFQGALSVGDSFLTVQSREEFLPLSNEAQGVVSDGFELVGVEAYSKTGNKLGSVSSFGFDPVFGTVTGLTLDSGSTFDAAQFVFFAPEFVFVDDGEKTAAQLREETRPESGEAKAEARDAEADAAYEDAAEADAADGNAADEDATKAAQPAPVEDEPGVTQFAGLGGLDLSALSAETAGANADDLADDADGEEAAEADGEEGEDAELIAFLLGTTTVEEVRSADGAFFAAKGTVLTMDIIEDARNHDALLLLTMSVDA